MRAGRPGRRRLATARHGAGARHARRGADGSVTGRLHAISAAPPDPTVGVLRSWRWSNVPLPEAHIGLMTAGVLAHVLRPLPLGGGRSTRRIGWLLVVTGVAFAVWATREVGGLDLERPDRVATTGPYAISRHPMYLAWTLVFVGVGLVLDTAWLMLLVAPLSVLVRREARKEEDRLTATFGADYDTYRARVRRYL